MENSPKKFLLIFAGWVSVVLGVIGIPLPLLPTTPFILLAAACFARSSPKFHHWIRSHRYFGPMINNFKTGQGIPKKARNTTIIFIWVMLGISMVAIGKLWSTLLLLTIGTAVTVYLMRIPAFEVQTADNNSI